ncbi:MAG: tetratricopeptide repeat protein [Bacteroidales bacterium]|nr:tetratricopeptide repeat protein [Bacteroidales bacterium]
MKNFIINKREVKGIVFIFIFLFTTVSIFSQSEEKALNITRLEKDIEVSPVAEKPGLLNSLSKEYLSLDPEKSKLYANNALELAIIINDEDQKAKALINLGDASYYLDEYEDAVGFYMRALNAERNKKNDTITAELYFSLGLAFSGKNINDTAILYIQRSIKIEEQLSRDQQLSNLYYHLGNIYHSSGDFQQALVYFQQALIIEESSLDKNRIAEINNYIGIVYFDLGSFEKALKYYLESLKLVEELQDKQGIAHTLNNIGIVYYEWGNKEKALEYYQKSLRIEEELNNNIGIADSYNNIGIIYSDWDQNELAIDFYNKAIDIYDEFGDDHGKAYAMNNIGESFFELGDHDNALQYLMNSLKIEQKLCNKLGIAQSFHTIGRVHFKLGDLNKAYDYNTKSFKIADSLKLSSVLLTNYELYYEIFEKRNNHLKALEFYQLYAGQKDTIFNKQFHNNLAEIQAKYEIDRIDRERELMLIEYQEKDKEIKTQRLYLVVIFVLMLVFGALVYYDIKTKIRANKKLININKEITEQKEKLTETLEELGKSETKYKNLVEHSPTGIIYIDKKGKILETNKKILEILGSPSEEDTKEINCLKYPPLQELGLSDAILKCIETGKMFFNEASYKSKWGKKVFLRYYITPIKNRLGNVSSLIINVEDVTYSKEAERSKKQSELKYQVLVENSLQAMLVVQEGELIFANSRMEELTLYKFDELTNKNTDWLKVLIHPDDYDLARQTIYRALKGQKTPTRNQLKYIRKDGKVRWIETQGTIIDYNGSQAILVVAIDVTERKETESILIESEKQLQNVNAMKDKFFSIIAHDLKNPFNAILGFSNLLYEAYDNFDEKQRKNFIKNICEASENTFKLLQNLLEWSRTQTGNIEYNPVLIDISVLVKENISELKSAATNKKLKIFSKIHSPTNVFADENMVKVVVRNLLSNAIKFTKPGGKVEFTFSDKGDFIEICVADTGIGIESKNLKRLFRIDDQFKTPGTLEEQGSGLGLILCKEFVEKNGGKIWAESNFESGSKFKFTLPAHKT